MANRCINNGNSGRLFFFFFGSKITADGDFSHEIKRCLLLGRKVMTNLDSILKSRDSTLPTKVHLVEAMVFPGVMHGCESWTIKKTEQGRIDAFELWCWRRLLRVPWTTRRSNQSTLKEVSPEYSLEGLMLKLKFQYFGHLMWRTDSSENTLMLGKVEGGRGKGQQWVKWLDGITNSKDMSLNWELVIDREAWHAAVNGVTRVRHDWATELNWTELGGVLLCRPLYRASDETASLLFSCRCWPAAGWGVERGYGDSSIPYAWLSSMALLPWVPGFPPQAFPTMISSLTSPRSISPKSSEALTVGLLHNP